LLTLINSVINNKMATRRISVNVGGLWRTDVVIEEEATWTDLEFEIEKATGILTDDQKLTPTGEWNKECELEDGDDVFCDWEIQDENHPLHNAAGDGNIKAIRSWIGSCVDVNMKYEWGETPLMIAASELKDESVAELLCLGADVKLCDKKNKTALHFVARADFFYNNKTKTKAIVKMLIKAGCDPMVRNNKNETFVDIVKRIHGKKIAKKVKLWIK
jgi:hypothetical protein